MLPSRIFFDDIFNDLDIPKRKENLMKCDIYEKGDKYCIEMEVPGYSKEEINMELSNGYLVVTAEKTSENKEDETKKYLRRERSYSKCQRQFYVGDIDENEVKAEFKNGELIILVPKEEKEKNTKKIINID